MSWPAPTAPDKLLESAQADRLPFPPELPAFAMDDPTPPPERPPEPSRPRGSCLGVLMVGMLISTALFALNLITMGVFGMVALIGAAILMFSLFHYLVWGWWLGGMIRSEVEAEEPADDEEGWS